MKAKTAIGFKTQLSELPCGNAQQHTFSFLSTNIKGGVAVKEKRLLSFLSQQTDLGLLENGDQRSQLLTREERERERKKRTSVTKATETLC